MASFTVRGVFRFAWVHFKRNWIALLGLTGLWLLGVSFSVLPFVLLVLSEARTILASLFPRLVVDVFTFSMWLGVFLLTPFVFMPALARAAVIAVRLGRVSFSQAFRPWRRLVGAWLISSYGWGSWSGVLSWFGGFLFSRPVVEGQEAMAHIVMLAIAELPLWCALYVYVDPQADITRLDGDRGAERVFRSMGDSLRFFWKHPKKVLAVKLLSLGLVFLGGLAFGVGLLVAVPVAQLAQAALYIGLDEGGLPWSGAVSEGRRRGVGAG